MGRLKPPHFLFVGFFLPDEDELPGCVEFSCFKFVEVHSLRNRFTLCIKPIPGYGVFSGIKSSLQKSVDEPSCDIVDRELHRGSLRNGKGDFNPIFRGVGPGFKENVRLGNWFASLSCSCRWL